ncbi:MAG: hypothetical protein AB8B55_22010 [Mariniblastus sp.]
MKNQAFVSKCSNPSAFVFNSSIVLIILFALFAAHPVFGQGAIVRQEIERPELPAAKKTDEAKEARGTAKAKSPSVAPAQSRSAAQASSGRTSFWAGRSGEQQTNPKSSDLTQDPREQQMLDEIKSIRARMGGGVAEQLKDLNLDADALADNQKEFEEEIVRLQSESTLANEKIMRQNPEPAFGQSQKQRQANHGAQSNQSDHRSAYNGSVRRDFDQQQLLSQERASFDRERRIFEQQREQHLAMSRADQWALQQRDSQKAGFQNAETAVQNQSQNYQSQRPMGHQANRQGQNNERRVGLLREAAKRLESLAAEFEEAKMYDEADETREQAMRFWQKSRN